MTKDAEKLLKYIVIKSEEYNDTEVYIEINELTNIPNIEIIKKDLLDELKKEKYIYDYKENILGELYTYLTTKGQEYFEEKGNENTMGGKNVIINVNHGQVSVAKDHGIIYATQKNGVIAPDKMEQHEKNKENHSVVNKKTKSGKMVQWGASKKKTISLIISLVILFAVILVINFSKLTGKDNKNRISNQDFAEAFCEDIKTVLLTPGDEQIGKVRTELDNLKKECDGDVDLEERYIYTLSKCGLLCCQLGYIYDASVFTEEAYDYVKELDVSDKNYRFIGLCYLNRAGVLVKQNQNLEAEECYLDAIHIFEQQGISYDSELAVLFTDLANFYYDGAEYAEALIYQEKAIEIWKYFGKTNSIDMGVGHIMMARICRYVDQKRVFSELMSAKNILENNKPESNEHLMILYGDLGGYYWSTDKIKAEDYFNQARELGLQLEGELGFNTISAEINLAYVYSDYGQIQKALEILESAVIKCEKAYGEAGIGSAYAYAELAATYGELQQYVKSIQYYEKAQAIYENVYGPTHPDVAYVLGNKANTLMRMGQNLEAIECVDRAINIYESNHNNTQSDMAALLKKKAEFVMLTQGDLGEVIQLLEQAKQIYQELYGDTSEYVIDIDLKIGQVYTYMENADSYRILNYVVERYKEIYNDNSLKMFEAYMRLGECLYEGLGEESEDKQMSKAFECFSKAADILELFDCTNSKDGIVCYEKLGMSSYNLNNYEEAIKYYQKAQDICFILQEEDSLEHRWLWARMARVYAYIGEEEKAKKYLIYTENFMGNIVDEYEQLKIYTDMLGTCIALEDDERRIACAQFLKSIMTEENTPNYIMEWVYANLE